MKRPTLEEPLPEAKRSKMDVEAEKNDDPQAPGNMLDERLKVLQLAVEERTHQEKALIIAEKKLKKRARLLQSENDALEKSVAENKAAVKKMSSKAKKLKKEVHQLEAKLKSCESENSRVMESLQKNEELESQLLMKVKELKKETAALASRETELRKSVEEKLNSQKTLSDEQKMTEGYLGFLDIVKGEEKSKIENISDCAEKSSRRLKLLQNLIDKALIE